MQVIIIGMGEVGKHLAAVLTSEKHDVTIIDSDSEVLDAIQDRLDAKALKGNGASFRTLRQAEAQNTDLVAAVTNDDEVNIVASLQAKALGAKKVIARIDSPDYLPGWKGAYHDLLGIDLVISPDILAASQVKKLIYSFGAVSVANFADDRVEMIQLPIDDKSKFNIPLKDLKTPQGTIVGAILRNSDLVIPSGLDSILPGDEIFVIGKKESIPEAETFFGKARPKGTRSVVILGGGDIGLALARSLEKQNIRVSIIEWDPVRCEYLSEILSEATIINGDGTDLELLKEEKVGEADIFVAASKRDEVNLMSSLVAKELGVKKTVALVKRQMYVKAYEHLGLDTAVSPRQMAANQILKYVRPGRIESVSNIAEGKGEILEFVAPEKSRITEKKIKDLNLPRGIIIGVIVGRRGAFVPTGEDQVFPTDVVVIFCTPQTRPAVEKLF